MHVTLRARRGVPSLRFPRACDAVFAALAAASRADFRVIHFSVQSDHILMIVEAHDKETLPRGLRGLTTRTALACNRALHRKGRVWGDRYHARPLATPREVRNGLVYVLMNFRKHCPHDRSPVDPCSSAPWFDGFRNPLPRPAEPPPTCRPRTWLASKGWHRSGGLLNLSEHPKTQPP